MDRINSVSNLKESINSLISIIDLNLINGSGIVHLKSVQSISYILMGLIITWRKKLILIFRKLKLKFSHLIDIPISEM